jgi:hypothetical protein
MPNFSLSKYQSILRAVWLTGVFAGLLFSCGEGIRLFPFPPVETAENTHSEWKSGEPTGYQKNVQRPEIRQGNPASKIQRPPPPPHFWTSGYHALDNAPLLSFSGLREADVLFDSGFFKSRLFSVSGASRAPPAQV